MGRRESLQASFQPWLQQWLFLLLLSNGIINPHSLLSYVRPWQKMKIRDVLLLATVSCKTTFAANFPKKHWGQTQSWILAFAVDLSLMRKEGWGVLFLFAIWIQSVFFSLSFWIWIEFPQHFCLQCIHFRLRWRGLVLWTWMQLQQRTINPCPDHKQNWLTWERSAMQLLTVKKSLFPFRWIYYFTILAAEDKFSTKEYWHMMLSLE